MLPFPSHSLCLLYDLATYLCTLQKLEKQPTVRGPPAAVLLLGGFSSTPGTRCLCLEREELHGFSGATGCNSKGSTVGTTPAFPTAAYSCGKLWSYMCTGIKGCLCGALTVLAKWCRRDLLTEANCYGTTPSSLCLEDPSLIPYP